MLKKAIIRTKIHEYMDINNINTIELFFNKLPDIYEFLKKEDLIPEKLTYDIFVQEAHNGLIIAQDPIRQMLRRHYDL